MPESNVLNKGVPAAFVISIFTTFDQVETKFKDMRNTLSNNLLHVKTWVVGKEHKVMDLLLDTGFAYNLISTTLCKK